MTLFSSPVALVRALDRPAARQFRALPGPCGRPRNARVAPNENPASTSYQYGRVLRGEISKNPARLRRENRAEEDHPRRPFALIPSFVADGVGPLVSVVQVAAGASPRRSAIRNPPVAPWTSEIIARTQGRRSKPIEAMRAIFSVEAQLEWQRASTATPRCATISRLFEEASPRGAVRRAAHPRGCSFVRHHDATTGIGVTRALYIER